MEGKSRRLLWKTIKRRYLDQWVVLADCEWPRDSEEPVSGRVQAHGADRSALLDARRRHPGSLILSTGTPLQLLPRLQGMREESPSIDVTAITSSETTADSTDSQQPSPPTGSRAVGLPGRIIRDPSIWGGKPILRGTRITIEHILGYLARGMAIEEVVRGFPGVAEQDVRDCIEFGFRTVRDHHRPEGDYLL